MSVNSSSNSSLQFSLGFCNRTTISIFTALFIIYILLLPLFILVIYVGCKRRRKQRSVATAAIMSHSDVLTFNVVVLEMCGVLGSSLYCYCLYTSRLLLMTMSIYIYSFVTFGQTLFHLLTCVDRYLAVVHPITYLQLRQRGGVRIRNVSIVCVWLLCFGIVSLISARQENINNFAVLLLGVSCIGVIFCSLSVLRVLIRPGPGEVGGNRERVDQSKLRAFYTVMAIMAALILRFLSTLLPNVAKTLSQFSDMVFCLVAWSAAWFALPSSLVLPLLFLHRAGKLPGCKRNTESG